MLMPCLCQAKYFMSMWHILTCHSYVVMFAITCDLVYLNVLKHLAPWIYLLHWLCTIELVLKEHMIAFICLTWFFPMGGPRSLKSRGTSCWRFCVTDFIMSPQKQKSRQVCGSPRSTILNTLWVVCRNKVNSGRLQCSCHCFWVQNIVLW